MKRRAFALTELLVVLGIVLLLLAVLLPVIQRAREDARNQSCRNNLKQLGLALHNYHDTFNAFPPGWVSSNGVPGTGPRIGWMSFTLPYMDHAPLYNQINFSRPPADDNGTPIQQFQTHILGYRCPIDPTPNLNPLRDNFATANYSGNYGHIAPRLAPLGICDLWPGLADAPMRSKGIFALNSSEGMVDITDGTSFTLLISERGVGSGAGIWAGVTDNAHADDAVTDSSHRSRPNAGWSSFSSRHDGGINILLCDGSSRFVNNKIESKPGPEMGVYQKLACKNDGQPTGEF